MINSLLVSVDLNHESSWRSALPYAVAISSVFRAKLHVLTVVPGFGMPIVGAHFPDGFSKNAVAESTRRLKLLIDDNVPKEILSEAHVRQGTIYKEIIAAANILDTDMIVLAASRPEMKDYLIGPNASRVVRHAKQSVAIIR